MDRPDRPSIGQASTLTPLQSQVDGLVGGFAAQATDWRSLAAMTAGGFAYRAGRIGMMGLGSGGLVRALSVGVGLTAEVSTFEGSHRALSALAGDSHLNPNLFRWEGQGGLRQGVLQSFITFGALKGAGRLASGENLLVQHLFQDSAMVLGHNASAAFGIAPRPTGGLAEQFLHAEATNLQLGAGMTLAHGMAPGLHALERGLDLSLGGSDVGTRRLRPDEEPLQSGLQPEFALEGPRESSPGERSEDLIQGPTIMMMGRRDSKGNRPSKETTRAQTRPVVSTRKSDPGRERARQELESVTQELENLCKKYEKNLEGMRVLLQKDRKSAENWEIYDRLLLRHSLISRKHLIGASALEPGGGAEKWPIPRIENAAASLRRALDESRSFYETLKLPALPPVPVRPTGVKAKSWEETIRMFRHLRIDSGLMKRILKRLIPESRRDNAMVLLGLEGLHGLINERPKDECQAVSELLEFIVNGNGSGFEMLNQVLVLTMNFQAGLLSRSEIMDVIHNARDFHRAYPQARGPFLELFTRRLLLSSRESVLVVPLLNFARQHLDAGQTVVLEPRSSIHQGIFATESPSSEQFRYAAGGILKEVSQYHQIETFAEKMASELVKSREAEPRKGLRQGIYIEIPKLSHDVEPERLRFWGRMALERAVPMALERIVQEDTAHLMERFEQTLKTNTEKGAIPSSSVDNFRRLLDDVVPGLGNFLRPFDVEGLLGVRDYREQLEYSLRQYWSAFQISLNRIEIAYGQNPRHLQILNVESSEPASERMISQLQWDIGYMRPADPGHIRPSDRGHIRPPDPTLPKKHLLLAHLLNDVGRTIDAVEFLRAQLNGHPHKRIREFYRDLFQDALEGIFPSASKDSQTNHPFDSNEILSFLSVFFETDLNSKNLQRILQIQHPEFEFGKVNAERSGDALKLIFPVQKMTSYGREPIGEFWLEMNLPKNESKLIAQISRGNIFPDDRGSATSVFVMDRIFELLEALKIPELRVEADDIGKYAWLRMGGEFLRQEDRVRVANLLQVREYPLPPGFSPRTAPTPLIVEMLASLEPREREEVLSSWPGSPIYRWDVEPGSPDRAQFRLYFREKQKAILKGIPD